MKLSKLAKIFKALSSETRLKLFEHIYKWQESNMKPDETIGCCEGIEKAFTKACGCMNISKSTISHHLKELQNADLINTTRSGQTASCKINEETLEDICNFLKEMTEQKR